MGPARSFRAVAALLMLGCATTPSLGTTASHNRCLVVDIATAIPDTVHAIVEFATQSTLDCERQSIARSEAPVVVAVTPPPGVDLRDVLEGRAGATKRPDVVATHDARLIDLARRSAAYLVEPLPWSATYVLVLRTPDSVAMPDAGQRDALARDAVAGDARGALEPFPWRTDAACSQPVVGSRATASRVVAYPMGDAIARAIAERVVSLASSGSDAAWLPATLTRSSGVLRATAMAADSVPHALTSARATAAVMAIPRDPSTPCGTRNNVSVPRGAIPLVDARPHVIVRRGSGAAFIVGIDGTLHFVKRGTR